MGSRDHVVLRRRLLEKGMTENEIDRLIDSTKHLSTSDFEFFLRSLGITLDANSDDFTDERDEPD